MTDKQVKEEIKQVVTNLGNIKFTVEDELEFCKEVLKRKEQECEGLKDEILHLRKEGKKSCAYCADLIAKEKECEKLKEEVKKQKEIAKEYEQRWLNSYGV